MLNETFLPEGLCQLLQKTKTIGYNYVLHLSSHGSCVPAEYVVTIGLFNAASTASMSLPFSIFRSSVACYYNVLYSAE